VSIITEKVSFLDFVSAENFKWALNNFNNFIRIYNEIERSPDVIITDEDPALIAAVETVFLSSDHQICSWHKSVNFKKHFASILISPKNAINDNENAREQEKQKK